MNLEVRYRSPCGVEASDSDSADDRLECDDYDDEDQDDDDLDKASDNYTCDDDLDTGASRRASEVDADDTRALIDLERNIANIERSMNNNGNGQNQLQLNR